MNFDFILVGQGLAGTILAHTLQNAGYTVVVIDQFREVTASKVAAGLTNPIAGKRVSLSWKAAELIPFAHTFYTALEEYLKVPFYYPLPLIKVFSSIEDQNTWLAKTADAILSSFCEENLDSCTTRLVNLPYGAMAIKQASVTNLPVMLSAFREVLVTQGCLIDEPFDYNELKLTNEGVIYNHLQAKSVIFCEGHLAKNNPWFSWLPLVPTKGEVLELELANNQQLNCIFNKAVYLAPQPNGRIKAGATYNWLQPTDEVTPAATEELSRKTADILTKDFTITGQLAGIRPAVRDRKPLIGVHPVVKQLYVFNGMGSKGVMMAPFFADQFVKHLQGLAELYKEVDCRRYYSLYS